MEGLPHQLLPSVACHLDNVDDIVNLLRCSRITLELKDNPAVVASWLVRTRGKQRAVQAVCLKGQAAVLQAMLTMGWVTPADLAQGADHAGGPRGGSGFSPLHAVCSSSSSSTSPGHVAVARLVLDTLSQASRGQQDSVVAAAVNAVWEHDAEADNEYDDLGGLWSTTPLHLACRRGATPLVELLLGVEGVDLWAVEGLDVGTALHVACKKGHQDVVELLLRAAGDRAAELVNLTGLDEFDTCLTQACEGGHIEVVRLLLHLPGVDVNALAYHQCSWSAFHHACAGNHVEVVRLLLSVEGIDLNTMAVDDLETPLRSICEEGHTEVMQLLLDFWGPEEAAEKLLMDDGNPVYHAVDRGRVDLVRLLLDFSNNHCVEVFDEHHVHAAAARGVQPKILQMFWTSPCMQKLLVSTASHEGSPASTSPAPISPASSELPLKLQMLLACLCGDAQVVRSLVGLPGVDVNAQVVNGLLSPFHEACVRVHAEVVQVLVSTGHADIHAVASEDQTALHLVSKLCREASGEVMRMLLGMQGVDVNARDAQGRTPLHYASNVIQSGPLELLLAAPGVDVNARDNTGATPLIYICNHRAWHRTMAKLLAAPGVEVNARDVHGVTALHYACYHGRVKEVQMLLQAAGIDPWVTTARGNTALHLTCVYNQECAFELVQLLLGTLSIAIFEPQDDSEAGFEAGFEAVAAEASGNATPAGPLPAAPAAPSLAILNAQDQEGLTPLHNASKRGYPQVVRLLLSQHGCSSAVVDSQGRTPLALARHVREHPGHLPGRGREADFDEVIAMLEADAE